MKLDNNHAYFNVLCCGCNAAIKQEDVDPDRLYTQLLCGRCCAELEKLLPRHQVVFDKLKLEMKKTAETVEFLEDKITVLEDFMIKHGLNPMEAV